MSITIILLLAIAVLSCAGPISRETLKGVDKDISLSDIQRDAAAYRGKKVLLGGEIVSVVNEPGRSLAEVLERKLDAFKRPSASADSRGRFLAVKDGFLDPEEYKKGLYITVAGKVRGMESRKLGHTTYDYVVIEITEAHIFRAERSEPRIHFGIGVGTTF